MVEGVIIVGYILLLIAIKVCARWLKRKRGYLKEQIKMLEEETKVRHTKLKKEILRTFPCIWERPSPIGVHQCCHAEIVEALLGMTGVYASINAQLCELCPYKQIQPGGAVFRENYSGKEELLGRGQK